jgi:hypothetical protein
MRATLLAADLTFQGHADLPESREFPALVVVNRPYFGDALYLRRKLDDPKCEEYVETAPVVGAPVPPEGG